MHADDSGNRATLSRLLEQVRERPRDHERRLQAAGLALDICLDTGDPHLADVAEALSADAPRMPRATRAALACLGAQAQATRRAACLARSAGAVAPRALTRTLAGDPEGLAAEVAERLSRGEPHVARAVLEVAMARHAGHPLLLPLAAAITDRRTEPREPTAG